MPHSPPACAHGYTLLRTAILPSPRTRLALSATSHHCGQTAWCIRVPHKAETRKLRDRLINFVELGIEGIKSPNLIISVVGDAYRVADKTMEQNLTSGLTKIAQSLVLWLSTPGTDSGITQYLGRFASQINWKKESRSGVPLIGVGMWGVSKAWLGDEKMKPNHLHTPPPKQASTTSTKNSNTNIKLEKDHSIFLLYDDQSTGEFGHELVFRTRFEKEIAMRKMKPMESQPFKLECNVQSVLLTVGGGHNTLQQVQLAILFGNPVVVVDGSGRAADCLTYAWRFLHDPSPQGRILTLRGLKGMVRENLVGEVDDAEEILNITTNWILGAVAVRTSVTVCTFDGSATGTGMVYGIQRSILKATMNVATGVLKGRAGKRSRVDARKVDRKSARPVTPLAPITPGSSIPITPGSSIPSGFPAEHMLVAKKKEFALHREKLFWSLVYGQPDEAQKYLDSLQSLNLQLRVQNNAETGDNLALELRRTLKDALFWAFTSPQGVKLDIVEMLAPSVNMYSFLFDKPGSNLTSEARIDDLFNPANNKLANPHLTALFSMVTYENSCLAHAVADGCLGQEIERQPSTDIRGTGGSPLLWHEQANRVIELMLNAPHKKTKVIGKPAEELAKTWSVKDKADYANFNLLVWATLTGNAKMAKYFWKETRNSVSSALFISVLAHHLSIWTAKSGRFKLMTETLVRLSDEFEALAIGVLDLCQANDMEKTREILDLNLREIDYLPEVGHYLASAQIDRNLQHLAAAGTKLDFMSHPMCLSATQRSWYGDIDKDTSVLAIIASIFVPFPMLFQSVVLKVNFGEGAFNKEINDSDNSVHPRAKEYNGLIGQGVTQKKLKRGATVIDRAHKDNRKIDELWRQSLDASVDHNEGTGEYQHLLPRSDSVLSGSSLESFASDSDAGDTEGVAPGPSGMIFGGKPTTIATKLNMLYSSPIVKFIVDVVSYLTFATLYTIMVLGDLSLDAMADVEIIVLAWNLALLMQMLAECRNIGLKEWLFSHWNWIEFVAQIFYYTGLFFRLLPDAGATQFIPLTKTLFAFGAVFLYIRFLRFYAVSETVGPAVIMLEKSLGDVIAFFAMFVIFMLAYGVLVEAIVRPFRVAGSGATSTAVVDFGTLKHVTYHPLFMVFTGGEMFLQEIMEETSCLGPDPFQSCGNTTANLLPYVTAVYLLLVNIVLVNLLIAMMGSTYNTVYEAKIKEWQYQRYDLLNEYSGKPRLPQPFASLVYLYRIFMPEREAFAAAYREDESALKSNDSLQAYALGRYLEQEQAASEKSKLHEIDDSLSTLRLDVATRTQMMETMVQGLDQKFEQEAAKLSAGMGGAKKKHRRNSLMTLTKRLRLKIADAGDHFVTNCMDPTMWHVFRDPKLKRYKDQDRLEQIHLYNRSKNKRFLANPNPDTVQLSETQSVVEPVQGYPISPDRIRQLHATGEYAMSKELTCTVKRVKEPNGFFRPACEGDEAENVETENVTLVYTIHPKDGVTRCMYKAEWQRISRVQTLLADDGNAPSMYEKCMQTFGVPWDSDGRPVYRFPCLSGDDHDGGDDDEDYMPQYYDSPLLLLSEHPEFKASFPKESEKNADADLQFGGSVLEEVSANPRGKTGLRGRGLLRRLGPNRVNHQVVTRWKLDSSSTPILRQGKPMLEVIMIRDQNMEWQLPTEFVDGMSPVVRSFWDRENVRLPRAQQGSTKSSGTTSSYMKQKDAGKFGMQADVKTLLSTEGVEFARLDCPNFKDTDDAWVEVHYAHKHDVDSAICDLDFGTDDVSWCTVHANQKLSIYSNHAEVIKAVAHKMDAYYGESF